MKKINIKIIPAFIFLIACFSCNKQLDIKPTQSVENGQALNTSNDVEAALVGSYSDLIDFDMYGGSIFVCADLLGDNNELEWSGTYQGMTQIYTKSIPVDNQFVSDTWLAGYAAINDVNNVLSALDVVIDEKKDRVEGEAKFIRGACYFDLVRMFGKAWNDGNPSTNLGVPIVLTPTTVISGESQLPRSTVAEVYAQALQDLKDAQSLLPAKNGFFANSVAASAMLARIYLQQGDFENAANAANKAITDATDNGYSLNAKYADEFPNPSSPGAVPNTPEDLFAMQVTTSSGTNVFQEFYSANGRGDIAITSNHLDLYESGDDRLNLFYTSGGSTYTGKFENLYGNVHILRLAEMYLVRAEANFRMGTSIGTAPVNDINKIRNRVNLPSYTSSDLTLDKILLERKLELAFEGFTLHDLKRTEGAAGVFNWNDPKLVYPIPQRELRVNANLTQNDGY
ncbi:MAG: RagB/SusD family nutrient uptake outer membrane protein [Bacteroidetes bacterium]|nr:RagB/SusD family nutrient uptake outer membrane protein [Bacteroidota bacterium]